MRRSSPNRNNARVWNVVLIAGLVVWTALAWSLDNGHLGVFQDDGLYLTSARSLRDGRGFGLPSRPGEPPPKYPIGLPATIAVALKLDPAAATLDREIAIGRGIVLVGGWIFFLAAHSWLRRIAVSPSLACLIVLATAYHQSVLIGGAITIFADLPFAGVVYVLMARWVGPDRKSEVGSNRRAFIDGLLAGYGFLLRSNGMTLAFAAILAAAIGPRRRTGVLSCLAGLAIAIVPATYYAGLHPRVVPSNSYLLEMKSGWSSLDSGSGSWPPTPDRRLANSPLASSRLRRPSSSRSRSSWPVTLPVPGRSGSRSPQSSFWGRSPWDDRAVGSICRPGLMPWERCPSSLVWPWTSIMDRFLLALIPLVLLAFASGLETLCQMIGVGTGICRKLVTTCLFLVLLGNLTVVARSAYLFHHNGRQWAGASRRTSLDEALQLIRDRTEANAVVAATWPEMVYLQTGRTVVPLVEDESILTGKLGDIRRLLLWREQTIGRPFYALVRSEEEDQGSPRIDLPQLRAVAEIPGLEVREVARTVDGRYGIYRVSDRTPADATLSK